MQSEDDFFSFRCTHISSTVLVNFISQKCGGTDIIKPKQLLFIFIFFLDISKAICPVSDLGRMAQLRSDKEGTTLLHSVTHYVMTRNVDLGTMFSYK